MDRSEKILLRYYIVFWEGVLKLMDKQGVLLRNRAGKLEGKPESNPAKRSKEQAHRSTLKILFPRPCALLLCMLSIEEIRPNHAESIFLGPISDSMSYLPITPMLPGFWWAQSVLA